MSGDVMEARKLIAENALLRNADLPRPSGTWNGCARRPEALETTSLHLDVLRDLKRIPSHICSVAYPVLEAAGEMRVADATESDPITVAVAALKSTQQ